MLKLQKIELPREKLIRYGPEKLTNHELFAVILRTGTKSKNVLKLSKEIIDKFEDKISSLELSELSKVEGIGLTKATQLIACFELGKRFLLNKKHKLQITPKVVWEEMADIRSTNKEHLVTFFLDARSQVIKREVISIGTVNTSLVHPREVFEPAIRYSASQIVVTHNHPTGDLEPSVEDMEVTLRLFKAGQLLGIQLVDHVIVTRDGWVSLRESGLIVESSGRVDK